MKRIISLILTVIMVATVLPLNVFAANEDDTEVKIVYTIPVYAMQGYFTEGEYFELVLPTAEGLGLPATSEYSVTVDGYKSRAVNGVHTVYFGHAPRDYVSESYPTVIPIDADISAIEVNINVDGSVDQSVLKSTAYNVRFYYADGIEVVGAYIPAAFWNTAVTVSGTCGTDLTWQLTDDGTLTISGTGDMYNYDGMLTTAPYSDAPWADYIDDIVSVVINEGVTSIGDYAFANNWYIEDVSLASTITKIGEYSFHCCTSLTEIELPNSLTYIGDYAFNMSSLTDVTIPSGVTHIGVGAFSTAYTDLTLNLDLSITRDNFSDIQWSDSYFDYDDTVYNHHLARVAAALSASAYNQSNVANDLQFLGFTDIEQKYVKPTSNNYNTVSFSIAQKAAWTSTGAKPVIAIVIKGTGTDKEWYSNFDIGMGSTHYGFDEAKEKVMVAIDEYIDTVIESWGEPFQASQIKFMVTGHSRGAAVANLVAADLTENYEHDGVYAYTFASPTVSTKATSDGFENIFNVVNREDFVTRIPLAEWGFARYGLDLVLPSKSHRTFEYSTFSYAYELITGEEYHGYNGTQEVDTLCSQVGNLVEDAGLYSTQTFVGFFTTMTLKEYFMEVAALLAKEVDIGGFGSKAVGDFWFITEFLGKNYANGSIMGVHDYNAYFTWMAAFSAEDLFGRNGTVFGETAYSCKRLKVKCPVDVFVYDESGVLVASVVNNEVVCNTLAVGVYGDEKIIDLPGDQEYRVEVIATDDGVVNYKVEEISIEGADATTVRTIRFDDIEISVNDTLTGSISEEQHNPVAEYQLIQNGTIVVNVDFDSDTSSDACNGNHSYGELTEYSDSEHRRICSSCNHAEYAIHNWDWENGVTNADTTVTYSCPDCQATMVREVNNFVLGELNDDGSVDKNDAIYLLYSVLFGDTQYPLNQTCDFNADGAVDKNDAIYLLYHALFGAESYPLN